MDTPLSIFSWLDSQLARVLPLALRIVVWGAAAAFVSMEIYRALSPQKRIRETEAAMRAVRAQLDAHEGSFEEGWELVRDSLRLAMRRLALVAPAAIAAALPLFLLAWSMSQAYAGARILDVGPAWAGGWELPFVLSMSAAGFATKALRGIA